MFLYVSFIIIIIITGLTVRLLQCGLETDRKLFLSYGRNQKVAKSVHTSFGRNRNKAKS